MLRPGRWLVVSILVGVCHPKTHRRLFAILSGPRQRKGASSIRILHRGTAVLNHLGLFLGNCALASELACPNAIMQHLTAKEHA
jgi:hypothetical protein